ncbi:MAG: hypothetical protein ACREF0_07150 [Acetobacteraceae bacterium]
MKTTTVSDATADALAYWTRDAIFSLGGSDETLIAIELKAMADGSGNWAVVAHAHDRDRNKHSYQTVIGSAGHVVFAGVTTGR